MWPRSAQVGQRVVCISDDPWLGYGDENVPKLNIVYTIRDIAIDPEGKIRFRLMEISNDIRMYKGYLEPRETAFVAHRFKPVDETRLDVFRAMLKVKHAKDKIMDGQDA